MIQFSSAMGSKRKDRFLLFTQFIFVGFKSGAVSRILFAQQEKLFIENA